MTEKDNKILWVLYLKESPWFSQTAPESFNSRFETIKIEDVLKLPYKDRFEEFDIYEHVNMGTVELYCIKNNELAAFFSYLERKNKPIKTILIWNNENYSGSLRRIFGEYIIPKFKIVESDNMMTGEAFGMWQKLIGFYPQYKFYAMVKNNFIPMKDPYDVFLYKEKMTDDNSPFVVFFNKPNL